MAAPANDLIANAIVLTPGGVPSGPCDYGWTIECLEEKATVNGTTVGATSAEDSGIYYYPYPGSTGPSVWYKFTPGADLDLVLYGLYAHGDYAFSPTFYGTYPLANLRITVYTGPSTVTSPADLTGFAAVVDLPAVQNEVGPGDTIPGWTTFYAKSGNAYYIEVAAAAGTADPSPEGDFGFALFQMPSPLNPSPPAGWKPTNILVRDALGLSSNFAAGNTAQFVYATANTTTFTKAPGRILLDPFRGAMLPYESKLKDTYYLLAVVAYDDPDGTASNHVVSITASKGTYTWSLIKKFTPGGVGLVHEVWIGKATVEHPWTSGPSPDQTSRNREPTFTFTLASATTQKGAGIIGILGLDPTTPFAGDANVTSTGALDHLDLAFDVGSLIAAPRKGLVFRLMVINSPAENSIVRDKGGPYEPWNDNMPAANHVTTLSYPVFPGSSRGYAVAPEVLSGQYTDITGGTRKGFHQLDWADFKQSPHPAYPPSGIRDMGYVLQSTSVGTFPPTAVKTGFHGIYAFALKGAPQS